jgi:hypothetical protein
MLVFGMLGCAGCTGSHPAPDGKIVIHAVLEQGSPGAPGNPNVLHFSPLQVEVAVSAPGHRRYTATSGAAGLLTMTVAPGRYRVTAKPAHNPLRFPGSCRSQPQSVRVLASTSSRVTVACRWMVGGG